MEDQVRYFRRQGDLEERAALQTQRSARVAVAGLLVIAGALTAAVFSNGGHYPHLEPGWLAEAPLVVLGTLPAVAAFFLIVGEGRAYEEHAHAYALAHAVFAEARRQSDELDPLDEQGWRELLLALGQEALTENAVWIATHRSRPVANHVG